MGIFDVFKKKKNDSVADNMFLYTEQELDEYEAFVQENCWICLMMTT